MRSPRSQKPTSPASRATARRRSTPYSGDVPVDAASERFAWVWLAAISGTFVVYLIVLGRWITRDAKRFERLRLDLE